MRYFTTVTTIKGCKGKINWLDPQEMDKKVGVIMAERLLLSKHGKEYDQILLIDNVQELELS